LSKAHMDQIRAVIADADQEERDLLKRRSEEARDSADTTMKIIFWGGLLGTLAVALLGWFISRSLARQIGAAVEQVRSSSAELQAAANQQASGAKEQATAMAEINTTTIEMLAAFRQVPERHAH